MLSKQTSLISGETNMTVRQLIIATTCLLIASSGLAAESGLPFGDTNACMQGPLQQFGRYIGDWNIEDEQLSRDTGQWEPGAGARWIFTCLGKGTAIQDFWLPASGNVGTNLRTYDAETGKWDIAWTADLSPGISRIQASQDSDGNIVMSYVSPVPTPLRRIIFYPPSDNSWNWQLEYSNDDGETWFAVYKIHATPH